MKKGDSRKKTGFTIIEVALVLAIAGLIFLMVFVALPQLQRQQRDSRRRDDILSFLETVKKYQTNNRGALPTGTVTHYSKPTSEPSDKTSWAGFYWDYLGDSFTDPSGGDYVLHPMYCERGGSNLANGEPCTANNSIIWGGDDLTFPNGYTLEILLQATCDGDTAVKSSNPRNIAVLYRLEGAGIYCANT